jgi:hypothetical protein
MLFTYILGLKTGLPKMLFTFLCLITQIWKKLILHHALLSSKSSREPEILQFHWSLLSLFLLIQCSLIQAVVAQYSRSLEYGLDDQEVVVPFQVGSRELYLLQGAGCYFVSVKRQGRESERSTLSGRELKNVWTFTYTPSYGFMLCCLTKHMNIIILIGYK